MKDYIPELGDIIYVDFDPQSGHEQKGKRPALVISKRFFNAHTKGAIVCPITSKHKEYPLHIELKYTKKAKGYVICEQLKSIDYKSRNAKYFDKIDESTLNYILELIITFFK